MRVGCIFALLRRRTEAFGARGTGHEFLLLCTSKQYTELQVYSSSGLCGHGLGKGRRDRYQQNILCKCALVTAARPVKICWFASCLTESRKNSMTRILLGLGRVPVRYYLPGPGPGVAPGQGLKVIESLTVAEVIIQVMRPSRTVIRAEARSFGSAGAARLARRHRRARPAGAAK